jgi:hypothetical protein
MKIINYAPEQAMIKILLEDERRISIFIERNDIGVVRVFIDKDSEFHGQSIIYDGVLGEAGDD